MAQTVVLPPDVQQYWRGAERVAVGDLVEYAGCAAVIVFVLEPESFSEGFAAADWAYLGRGVGVLQENGTLYVLQDASEEEDLVLLRRPDRERGGMS
jgi:hypothetical protein